MTLEEKVSLLSGADFWHKEGVERPGIESIMKSDDPKGHRKQDEEDVNRPELNDSIKAVCFPAASATPASFDRNAVKIPGESMMAYMPLCSLISFYSGRPSWSRAP